MVAVLLCAITGCGSGGASRAVNREAKEAAALIRKEEAALKSGDKLRQMSRRAISRGKDCLVLQDYGCVERASRSANLFARAMGRTVREVRAIRYRINRFSHRALRVAGREVERR
jgi:hypothetical protein